MEAIAWCEVKVIVEDTRTTPQRSIGLTAEAREPRVLKPKCSYRWSTIKVIYLVGRKLAFISCGERMKSQVGYSFWC